MFFTFRSLVLFIKIITKLLLLRPFEMQIPIPKFEIMQLIVFFYMYSIYLFIYLFTVSFIYYLFIYFIIYFFISQYSVCCFRSIPLKALKQCFFPLQISIAAIKSEMDEVALQGIEFWSSVCDEEMDLAIEAVEACGLHLQFF